MHFACHPDGSLLHNSVFTLERNNMTSILKFLIHCSGLLQKCQMGRRKILTSSEALQHINIVKRCFLIKGDLSEQADMKDLTIVCRKVRKYGFNEISQYFIFQSCINSLKCYHFLIKAKTVNFHASGSCVVV